MTPDYVTYVWFDALLNYVTAAGYLQDEARFARRWPQALHLIGKDILTTHSVYWPTMLQAAGLPLPKTIFAHGWWVIGGQKMGKSLGNAVPPAGPGAALRRGCLPLLPDARDDAGPGRRLRARALSPPATTADLANNLGNLLHRVTHMIGRYCGGAGAAPGRA